MNKNGPIQWLGFLEYTSAIIGIRYIMEHYCLLKTVFLALKVKLSF